MNKVILCFFDWSMSGKTTTACLLKIPAFSIDIFVGWLKTSEHETLRALAKQHAPYEINVFMHRIGSDQALLRDFLQLLVKDIDLFARTSAAPVVAIDGYLFTSSNLVVVELRKLGHHVWLCQRP